MKYTKGSIGRVFVLKFDDRDILLEELKAFIRKEKVRSAAMVFIGALKKGVLVTGPKKPVIPPEPNRVNFKDAWEAVGVGTIFSDPKGGPQIHIHAGMGRKKGALIGCVRERSSVFLVMEAIVFELKGVRASKSIDPETGLNLLRIVK
ncbi:MAG: DUF296 domain-containing protein [Candidatus Omnitrophota bacterium]